GLSYSSALSCLRHNRQLAYKPQSFPIITYDCYATTIVYNVFPSGECCATSKGASAMNKEHCLARPPRCEAGRIIEQMLCEE
ncbi:MAG: hypothetical protein KAX20_00245, partial [Candidatus Omnitrophica bacterium]|nr:hypothetical protein [Candidatus Omnitrophota bacterium]